MPIPRSLVFAASLFLAVAGIRAADPEPEVALQRALDQPLSLTLPKVPLSEAFKQIATAAKIPLQVDPASYELLPYGETTQVSVKFEQSRLRDALAEVLIPLGLQQAIVGTAVLIRPSSPLAHIGRRADWEELKLLNELWKSDDLKPQSTGPFNLTDALRRAMEGRKDLIIQMSEGPGSAAQAAHDNALELIRSQLPMTAYRALDFYCKQTNQVWFVEAGPAAGGPTGGTIRIMSPRQWIERQLDRPIQLSRTNEPLEVVVADLTHVSGIRFVPEPGLYQAVPVVTLRSDNATVRQTLEILAGATRIAFDVRDDSILLHMAPGPGNAPPASDNILGRMTMPVGKDGVMMELFFRESDLTPELKDAWKKRRDQMVEAIQKALSSPPPAAAPPGNAPSAQVKQPESR